MLNTEIISEEELGVPGKFPRLMQSRSKKLGWIVEVHEHPDNPEQYIGIHRAGEFEGSLVFDFQLDGMIDYDGAIQIRNE